MNKKIAIVYFSAAGHTQLMAEKIAVGAESVAETEVAFVRVIGTDIVEGRYANEALVASLASADAVVFGTPTYMGGVSAQLKAFIDAMGGLWHTRALKDKIAGGFTHSSSPAGDKSSAIAFLHAYADQLGMLWVGAGEFPFYISGAKEQINRTGFYAGAAGYGNGPYGSPAALNEGDAKTAELYGRRIAEIAHRLA